MAAQKIQAGIPQINISQDNILKNKLRKYKKFGKLMTAKLSDSVLTDLRMTLEAFPDSLQGINDALNIIMDSGCSYITTGFEDDFKKGTLKLLKEPIELDGI